MKKLGVIGLVLAFLLSFSVAALAETKITATGSGQVTLTPDMATVNLGVTATDVDVNRAMAAVNQRLDQVRQALSQGGVQAGDISMSEIYMYSNYDYSQQEERLVGYTVAHQIVVKVRDTAQLGALIDSAVAAGANQLNGVSLSASGSEEAYAQALALAVGNARAHAQAIAQAEGLTLTELEELTETDGGYNYRNSEAVAFDAAAGDSGTQVDIGSMTVSASVTAVFQAE